MKVRQGKKEHFIILFARSDTDISHFDFPAAISNI